MENYKCHITIDNRTSHHLKLQKQDIPWGHFQEGPEKDRARQQGGGEGRT
jgi:hypothetical protein